MRLLSSSSSFTQQRFPFKGNTLLRRSVTGLTLAMFVLLMATSTARGSTIIYVDASASGADTGLNWTDAYPKLQDALAAAVSGDQIWVATEVYYPDEGGGMTNDDRTATFTLISGVEVYGGFAGTETSLGERDWDMNVTVLSGDIDQNDTTDPNGVVTDVANITGSNAYHVLKGGGTDSSAFLDGFTVTAGQANGISYPDYSGGGMYNDYSNPTLTNVSFSGNHAHVGGGMYNNYSDPTLTNAIFSGNQATYYGGGMENSTSNSILTNVSFIGNQADDGGGMDNGRSNPTLTNVSFIGNQADLSGGGMYNYDSSPTLTNAIFSGNQAVWNGGGMLNYSGGNPTLTNVSFSGNHADRGGGIRNGNSNLTLTNVIIWNNQAVSSGDQIYGSTLVIEHSDIQGSGGSGAGWDSALGTDGGNNLDADPLFVTPVDPATAPTTTGDLHLGLGSPAVDSGLDSVCPAFDMDGIARPQGAACDMGTYERVPNSPPALLLSIFRSPASIIKGSATSGPNQWFARVALSDHTGDPGLAFHYVVWLHVPEDWTLPWATQYSFTGDFGNTTLTPDWPAQSWVQDVNNCSLGGAASVGLMWRSFQGPLEALPALVDRLDNQVNLRGGLDVPSGETSDIYGGVRVVVGTYYDSNADGSPDQYHCDHIAVTTITVTD